MKSTTACDDQLNPDPAVADEASRVVDRLRSSDPQFDDCDDAATVIEGLKADIERYVRINAELATELAKLREQKPHEIALGKGEIVIWPIRHDGVHGLAFVKADNPKAVGTSHAEPDEGYVELGAGDSAIYFGNAESAAVLADRLQHVISLMNPANADPAPAPAVPAVVFVAHNKTSSILFAARKDAEQYVAGFGPAAGVLVTECAVIGSQSSTQAPAVPDPELVAAVTYYLKADDDLKEATRRTGFGGMGNPTASVKERYRVGAIRHAARKKLDTLLQSAPQAPAVPKEWRRAVSEFLSSHDAAWAELFKSLPADTRSVTVSNHQADAVRKANALRALLQSAEVTDAAADHRMLENENG